MQDNYEVLKAFKDDKNLRMKMKAFREIKKHTSIKGLQSYKQRIVKEKVASRVYFKVFTALKLYSDKMRRLKRTR